MNVSDNKNNDYPYCLIFKNGNTKGGKILKFVENRISYLKDEWQHPGVLHGRESEYPTSENHLQPK